MSPSALYTIEMMADGPMDQYGMVATLLYRCPKSSASAVHIEEVRQHFEW